MTGMTIGRGFLRVEEFRCWSERSFRNISAWMMTLANPTTRTTTGIDGFGWFVHASNHVWCKFSYCSASFVNSSTYVHFYHWMAFYEGHKTFEPRLCVIFRKLNGETWGFLCFEKVLKFLGKKVSEAIKRNDEAKEQKNIWLTCGWKPLSKK